MSAMLSPLHSINSSMYRGCIKNHLKSISVIKADTIKIRTVKQLHATTTSTLFAISTDKWDTEEDAGKMHCT